MEKVIGGAPKVDTVQVSVLRESKRCSLGTSQAASLGDPLHVAHMPRLPTLTGPMFGGHGVEGVVRAPYNLGRRRPRAFHGS